jgi:hypothetical protein
MSKIPFPTASVTQIYASSLSTTRTAVSPIVAPQQILVRTLVDVTTGLSKTYSGPV